MTNYTNPIKKNEEVKGKEKVSIRSKLRVWAPLYRDVSAGLSEDRVLEQRTECMRERSA